MTSLIKGSNDAKGYCRIGRTRGICAAFFTCFKHSLRLHLRVPSVINTFVTVVCLQGYDRIDR